MIYYWIRNEDLKGQIVIDEIDIDDKVAFVKVTDAKGAIIYNTEHQKERNSYGNKSLSHKPCAV